MVAEAAVHESVALSPVAEATAYFVDVAGNAPAGEKQAAWIGVFVLAYMLAVLGGAVVAVDDACMGIAAAGAALVVDQGESQVASPERCEGCSEAGWTRRQSHLVSHLMLVVA